MTIKAIKPSIFHAILLAGALLLFISFPAHAGTAFNPRINATYSSIQAALNGAIGDEIILCDGLFVENGIIWPDYTRITLKASTETTLCTIDASSSNQVFNVGYATTELTVQGITIMNVSYNIDGGAFWLNHNNIKLNLNNVKIINCKLTGSDRKGGAVYVSETRTGCRIIAKNCIFKNNDVSGSGAVGYNGSWEATNCVFYLNTAEAGAGGVFNGNSSSGWKLTNCIFWDNYSSTGGKVFGSTAILNVRYSDIQPNGWPATVGTGCISIEPKFISVTEGGSGYLFPDRLSPCIDTGTNEPLILPAKDLAGMARVHGGRPDMGVYETQAPSIRLIYPNGDEQLTAESTVNITWSSSDEYGYGSPNITIRFSSDEGSTWIKLADETNDGSYSWQVTPYLSEECLISIEAKNSSGEVNMDSSDFHFSVYRRKVYVSPTSGDDFFGTGTIESPVKTIQKGLYGVTPSGEVYLMPDTYSGTGNRDVRWPNKMNLTLKLSPEATAPATIDAQALGRAISIESAVNLTIEGITIKSASKNLPGGAIYNPGGNSLWLYRVIIRSCTAEGTNNGGGIYSNTSLTNINASNCLFLDNKGNLGGAGYNGRWYVTNCTFYNNFSRAGQGGVIAGDASTMWYGKDCIYWDNFASTGNAVFMMANPFNSYSDIQPDGWALAGQTACVSLEPRFVSETYTDPAFLRLMPASPCINTGTWDATFSTIDLAGIPRRHGGWPDMGAYEFQGPSMKVLYPNGGEVLTAEGTYNITWSSVDEYGFKTPPPNLVIRLSIDGGTTWTLVTNEVNDGSYSWLVPPIPSENCLISIEAINSSGESNYDVSNYVFSILRKTVYVSTTGDDVNGTGTLESPFLTIDRALNGVTPSGEVLLKSGRYTGAGNYNITWPAKINVTLKLSPEATSPATIDAATAGRIISLEAAVNLTVESITMTKARVNGHGGAFNLRAGTRLWLKNVIIKNCTAEGGGNGGAVYCPDNTTTFVNAKNCVFARNVANLGGVANSGDWNALNCTFVSNEATGGAGGVSNTSAWYGTNNIFWYNNSLSGAKVLTAVGTNRYSNFQSDSWPTSGLTACISLEPKFVSMTDSAPDYLRLGKGSPCIDTASREAPNPDIAGNYRPRGAGYDMGAYEFQGPSIRVISPNGGEIFTADQSITVQWTTSDETGLGGTPVNLTYSKDGGSTWIPLVSSQPASGTYSWTVHEFPSGFYLISAEVFNTGSVWNYDTSDKTFSIYRKPIYVSPTLGSDTNTGTIESPLQTIDQAMTYIAPTGEVRLMPGVYKKATFSGDTMYRWPNKVNITIKLSPEATAPATIDAESKGRLISFESYAGFATIEGITMMNGRLTTGNGAAIVNSGYPINIHLKNVIVKYCTAEAGSGGVAYLTGNWPYLSAKNSIFSGNKASLSGGVIASNSTYESFQAVNCIFTGNLAVNYGGVFASTNVSAEGCVFAFNRANAAYGVSYGTMYKKLLNSIFWYNSAPSYPVFISLWGTIKYNDFQNNAWLSGMGTTKCISIEPMWVSTSEPLNFHLQEGSPCINKGTWEAAPYDFDGRIRPRGGFYDMGAYEFSGLTVNVIKPNGGEVYTGGTKITIIWSASDESGLATPKPITIRFSSNNGASWLSVTQEANTGYYTWEAPAIISNNCLISIEVENSVGKKAMDVSDAVFRIGDTVMAYVSPSGSDDAGNGSVSNPFRTINKGLTVAATNCAVWLMPGLYNEPLDYNIAWPGARNNISLRNTFEADGTTGPVTIDAQGKGRMFIVNPGFALTSQNLTIEGVVMKNGYANVGGSYNGACIRFDGTKVVQLWLRNVMILHCTAEGSSSGGAIYCYDINKKIYAENTVIHGSNKGGSVFWGDMTAVNCAFTANDYGLDGSSGGTRRITNCIVYFNSLGVFAGAGTRTIKYTDIQGGYTGTGNISSNPSFVSTNENSPDFQRLNPTSPCIDSGTIEGAPAKDYEGNIRPYPPGGRCDMGIYEYMGVVTPEANPLVTVEAPNSYVFLTGGATYEIRWKASSEAGLKSKGISIQLSTDSGVSFGISITPEVANTGIYTWEVNKLNSSTCRIQVQAESLTGRLGSDMSDADFEISSRVPIVTVEAPNTAIVLTGGSTYEIKWKASSEAGIPSKGISIKLSTDSGGSFGTVITPEVNNTGIFTWEVPMINSDTCRVSVEARDNSGAFGSDMSNVDFTISTEVGEITIEGVKVNGITLLDMDIISQRVNLDLHVIGANGVSAARVYIDNSLDPITLTPPLPPGTIYNGWWSGFFTITPEAPERHRLTFFAQDIAYNSCLLTMEVRVMVGDVQVVGTPLNYPNPFKPLSGGATMINYTLSKDSPVTIIIYDITGSEVKRMRFSSGSNGGRAGINSISWNGRNIGEDVVGNGMYLYKIVYRDRVLGTGRLVVLD